MTIIAGERSILLFRKVTLLKMLELEIKGIGRRGISAYAIIKSEFGHKGNKQKVRDSLKADIDKEKAEFGIGDDPINKFVDNI